MSSIAKTIVATGASSGLGFELVKQLLEQAQPYRFILGCRDTKSTQAALDKVKYDADRHSLTLLPLELADLGNVKTFAADVLKTLGNESSLDYLLLNAAIIKSADQPGPHGSKWCESHLVNHLAQHYLIHLLREKLVASKGRVVVVSSGAIRGLTDTSTLESTLKAEVGGTYGAVYSASKFVQLLGALHWRRQLAGECAVVACSPGMIPGTGLARHLDFKPPVDSPDAKSIPEGARSIIAALVRDDIPEDPDRIFLTSWGEWWEKDVYSLALDRKLQDEWCPSKEAIEQEYKL